MSTAFEEACNFSCENLLLSKEIVAFSSIRHLLQPKSNKRVTDTPFQFQYPSLEMSERG